MKKMLSPFIRWGHWGSEIFCKLPIVTHRYYQPQVYGAPIPRCFVSLNSLIRQGLAEHLRADGRGDGTKKGTGFGARLSGFEFQICHRLAVWLGQLLSSLWLSFPAYGVGIKIEVTYSRAGGRVHDTVHQKHLAPVCRESPLNVSPTKVTRSPHWPDAVRRNLQPSPSKGDFCLLSRYSPCSSSEMRLTLELRDMTYGNRPPQSWTHSKSNCYWWVGGANAPGLIT